jgi:uncharacterized Ntn-hydrolase superfamily protein
VTFSLAGRCPRTGMLGAVVSPSSPAVGARCLFAQAGVGAALSQNYTDPMLGAYLLDRLANGYSASEAMADITKNTRFVEYRQLLVVDSLGRGATCSGIETLPSVRAWSVSSVQLPGTCWRMKVYLQRWLTPLKMIRRPI